MTKNTYKDWCPKCKTFEHRWDGNPLFCSVCGNKLIIKPPKLLCSKCSQEVRKSDGYCINCGVKFKKGD